MIQPENCPSCHTALPRGAVVSACPQCRHPLGPDEPGRLSAASTTPDLTLNTNERIGRYRILERLGEGGMGTVYLVEQEEPIRRRAALKLIKPGLDSAGVLARFEAERQALALMSHSGVAKVFDAGMTPDGRPYFVMEHVAGLPITEYCDRRRLGLRERLGLFVQVCEAIQHAHQKGILHRDIKPSNILVAEQDDRPVAKVIDFGVAKATSQRLTERTLHTVQGAIIGTPEYMSPEQAGLTALEVDARTDVYSLGVLLYELLVGARPFDLAEPGPRGVLELLRAIREMDPPTLAARMNAAGVDAAEVAQRRQTDARALTRALRGELEWITARALEKEPARRYSTVSDLAADVERHLAGQPVQAGPSSAAYRLRRWARRRRPYVIAVVVLPLVAAALVAGALRWRPEQAPEERLRAILNHLIATGRFPGGAGAMAGVLSDSDQEQIQQHISRDPEGEIARLAYRAAAAVRVEVPAFGLLSEPPEIRVAIGGWLPMLLLPAEISAVWKVEVFASVDGKAPVNIIVTSWGGTTVHIGQRSIALMDVMGPDAPTEGPHRLAFSATIARYSVSADPENLTASAPLEVEIRDLGSFPVSLFATFPPDFPPVVMSDTPIDTFLGFKRMQIVTATLPPRSGRCIRFSWPGGATGRTETVCLPSEDLSVRDLIVGFDLIGDATLDPSHPIATTGSVSIAGSDEPVLSFELASLGCRDLYMGQTWASQWADEDREVTFMTGRGGICEGYAGHHIRARLEGRNAGPLYYASSLARDKPIQGVLRFTPSRSAALAARLDRYLGNSATLPIEITVSEVEGAWIDEDPR